VVFRRAVKSVAVIEAMRTSTSEEIGNSPSVDALRAMG
jgi:hypothetical protein